MTQANQVATTTNHNEEVTIGSIWGVAKRATYRTFNTIDMATAMAERTIDEANNINKAWAVESSIKRKAELQNIASRHSISDEELNKLFEGI